MSVINDVLQELENKSSAFTPLELTGAPTTKAQNYRRNTVRVGGFSLLIILLLSAVYKLYPFHIVERTAQFLKIQPVDTVSQSAPGHAGMTVLPELDREVNNRAITGLQLKETINFMELSLQLPLGAQSFLKQSSQQRYVFLISNAGKKIITPLINDNSWLNEITVHDTEAGVEIQFDTADYVLVETRHQEKGQYYDWVIRLKKSNQKIDIKTFSSNIESESRKPLALNTGKVVQPGEIQLTTESVENDKKNKSDKVLPKQVKLQIKPVTTTVSDADKLMQAQLAMQQKDWVSAHRQLLELLDSPVDKKARLKLLTLYQIQQKTIAMKQLLSQSLRLYPAEEDFLLVDAGLLFTEKKFQALIERYNSKLNNKGIINLLAASSQSTGQHDKAIKYYQLSLKIDSQQPRKWISLAISQEQVSLFEGALQSYKIAAKSGSINAKLRSFIASRVQQLSKNYN